MAGLDIYTDPETQDIVFDERGDFRWTKTTQESLRQRLQIRLTVWMGEWSFNVNFGTPYEQRLLRGGLSKEQLDTEIRTIILMEPDVLAVENIVSSLDRDVREYKVQRVDVIHNNELIQIPVANPAQVVNQYPEPREPFLVSDICVLDPTTSSLESVNLLHRHINIDGLPQGTSSTWFNEWIGR